MNGATFERVDSHWIGAGLIVIKLPACPSGERPPERAPPSVRPRCVVTTHSADPMLLITPLLPVLPPPSLPLLVRRQHFHPRFLEQSWRGFPTSDQCEALDRRRGTRSPTCIVPGLFAGTPRLLCSAALRWHACHCAWTGTTAARDTLMRCTPVHPCASRQDVFSNPRHCGSAATQLAVAACGA